MNLCLRLFAAAASLTAAVACNQDVTPQVLNALDRSGTISFVCVSNDASGAVPNGSLALEDCGVGKPTADRRMLALVTQTLRGEVAVLDLASGRIVDTDPQLPSQGFLPVGAAPVDITSTPGGAASFVAVGAPGYEGIFTLPTTCILAPGPNEPPRDVTTWPACRLPAAPGRVAVVLDPTARESCPGYPAPTPPARTACLADLSAEGGPAGRRLLAVTMPSLGTVWLLDAQKLVNQPQGSFESCEFAREAELALQVELPPARPEQVLPPELLPDPALTCPAKAELQPPAAASYSAVPSGLALSRVDCGVVPCQTLFLGDLAAPVIHEVDVSDPCVPVEREPLLPVSFNEPTRVVTSSDLAVSPTLPISGKQFLYAIDQKRGSVMAFDVSRTRPSRTPIVRPNSQFMPFEPPDRLAFASPVRSLTFALHDIPNAGEDPSTIVGTRCEPDPTASGPGTRYRPNVDLTTGAGPTERRGVFAFLALADGQVAVVDVEDFDEPCRRPLTGYDKDATAPDFRGCEPDPVVTYCVGGDPPSTGEPQCPYVGGTPTVTREASCRVVEPHRARSAAFVETTLGTGTHAPSLIAFPQLGTGLPKDSAPQLIAVDFAANQPAEVRKGGQLYRSVNPPAEGVNWLDLSPNPAPPTNPASEAHQGNSVALYQREPRGYFPREQVTATYEGMLVTQRTTGFLHATSAPFTLADDTLSFCGRGVQDMAAARLEGQRLGLTDASELDAFAASHADRVQLQSAIPAADNPYWASVADPARFNYDSCAGYFGPAEEPSGLTPTADLSPARDLPIAEAYGGRLVLALAAGHAAYLEACFPGVVSYAVRAGQQWVVRGDLMGFQHAMLTGADGRCVAIPAGCDRFREFAVSRAYEVSCTEVDPGPDGASRCGKVGYDPSAPHSAGFACGMTPAGKSSPLPSDNACVFENATHRFAVYRGIMPSTRDSQFSWIVQGGFLPQAVDLGMQTAGVLPQELRHVAPLQQLVVVDGISAGVLFIDLNTLGIDPERSFF